MPAPAPLAHPPRPRGCRRRARPGASRPAGARVGDRRAAPRRSEPPRAQRAAALRRATSTRSGASSRRCRRRTCTSSATASLGLECFPAPGHASHHVCYLDAEGTLYAGDAAGVRIRPSRSCSRQRRRPNRPRGLGADDRRDRAPRARAARADPLRRLRGRRAPPGELRDRLAGAGPSWCTRRLARGASSPPLRRSRALAEDDQTLRAGDAVLAVVLGLRATGTRGSMNRRSGVRELPPALRRRGRSRSSGRISSPIARRVRRPRPDRLRDGRRPRLRRLDARADLDAARRRRRRRPPPAAARDDRLRHGEPGASRRRWARCSSPATRRSGSCRAPARRRRGVGVLLAGLERDRPADRPARAAPAGERVHGHRALLGVPARRRGRRHPRGDDRPRLRLLVDGSDVRDERAAARAHPPAPRRAPPPRRTSSASCARAGRRSPSTPGSGC